MTTCFDCNCNYDYIPLEMTTCFDCNCNYDYIPLEMTTCFDCNCNYDYIPLEMTTCFDCNCNYDYIPLEMTTCFDCNCNYDYTPGEPGPPEARGKGADATPLQHALLCPLTLQYSMYITCSAGCTRLSVHQGVLSRVAEPDRCSGHRASVLEVPLIRS